MSSSTDFLLEHIRKHRLSSYEEDAKAAAVAGHTLTRDLWNWACLETFAESGFRKAATELGRLGAEISGMDKKNKMRH